MAKYFMIHCDGEVHVEGFETEEALRAAVNIMVTDYGWTAQTMKAKFASRLPSALTDIEGYILLKAEVLTP